MAIFIDTGIFVGARIKEDTNNHFAIQTLKRIRNNEFGAYYTSDYIFDEAIILMGARTKRYDLMRDMGEFILTMPKLNFLYTDQVIFNSAWNIHEKYSDRILSFTDASIIAWCESLKIKKVATIDGHFDGILQMVKV